MSLHLYETAHESIKNDETWYRGISVQIVDRFKFLLSTLNGDVSALLGLKSQLDEAGESQHGESRVSRETPWGIPVGNPRDDITT